MAGQSVGLLSQYSVCISYAHSVSIPSVFSQYSMSQYSVNQYSVSFPSVFSQYSITIKSVYSQYSVRIQSVFLFSRWFSPRAAGEWRDDDVRARGSSEG